MFGEICHIEAAESGGPRYNSKQTDEDRRHYDNLILLCRNHHKATDDEVTFSRRKVEEYEESA
ncbi:HNH endonuclease [Candidatus Nitrososphaera sp. FF02]|uniref:HNH endonuclease n=1 Tax=Candidatus Nitrososphaera sp. FF02 TaxID=3398226 RepID=UPI0039E969B6